MTFPVEGLRWKKTDESDRLIHCKDHIQYVLVYGRTYTVKEDHTYSKTNSLIKNLKIPPQETHRLKYKHDAILCFAHEVTDFLSHYQVPMSLVPMPPSKTWDDPEYDDRLEQVAKRVSDALAHIAYCPILYRIRSVPSSYKNPQLPRVPEQIYKDLAIDKSTLTNNHPGDAIVLLDDVLTSGAQYSAARRRVLSRLPTATVKGLFWAKSQMKLAN